MSQLKQKHAELFCYDSLLIIYQLILGIAVFNSAWILVRPEVESVVYYNEDQFFSVRFGLVLLILLVVALVLVTLPFVLTGRVQTDIEEYIQTPFSHPFKYTIGLCLGVLFGCLSVLYLFFSISSYWVAGPLLFGMSVSSFLTAGNLQNRVIASSAVWSFGGTTCVGLGAIALMSIPYGVLFVSLGTLFAIAARVVIRRRDYDTNLEWTPSLSLLFLLLTVGVVGAADMGVPIGGENVEISCINLGNETVSSYEEVDRSVKQNLPPVTKDNLQKKGDFDPVGYEDLNENEAESFRVAIQDNDYTYEGVSVRVASQTIIDRSVRYQDKTYYCLRVLNRGA